MKSWHSHSKEEKAAHLAEMDRRAGEAYQAIAVELRKLGHTVVIDDDTNSPLKMDSEAVYCRATEITSGSTYSREHTGLLKVVVEGGARAALFKETANKKLNYKGIAHSIKAAQRARVERHQAYAQKQVVRDDATRLWSAVQDRIKEVGGTELGVTHDYRSNEVSITIKIKTAEEGCHLVKLLRNALK
jgi:hypothetical protein